MFGYHTACSRIPTAKRSSSQNYPLGRHDPFKVVKLVGRNAIRLELPSYIRIYPVVHVSRTKHHREQPADIAQKVRTTPVPVVSTAAVPLFKVDRILSHRRRGRGYEWVTLMKHSSTNEAQWQPTRDFVHDDGTFSEAFRNYMSAITC